MTTITAKITARGEECTTVDRGDAVEATIYADGVAITEVTLLPHEDGTPGWTTWGGCPDYWCSEYVVAEQVLGEDYADIIVSAVEAADRT